LLFPMLDVACDGVVKVLETLSVPPVGSPAETRLQAAVRQMLPKLWEEAYRFAPQVCIVTRTCIGVFQSRFLGADTFEHKDFVHTSHYLGKGTEGVVQLGFQLSQGGRRVAIKKIEQSLIDRHHWADALNTGFAFLLKADHPSIVKLYHVERLPSCWYVYMEYIDGGDLRSFLFNEDSSRKEAPVKMVLSEAKAKEVFRKLVEPVDYLRRCGVIHRDLK
jgi:serine/threonine protein kinase